MEQGAFQPRECLFELPQAMCVPPDSAPISVSVVLATPQGYQQAVCVIKPGFTFVIEVVGQPREFKKEEWEWNGYVSSSFIMPAVKPKPNAAAPSPFPGMTYAEGVARLRRGD